MRLEKEGARKPVIIEAKAYPNSKYENGQWLFGITMWNGDPAKRDYTMYLDQKTMLSIVQDWLRVLNK